MISAILSYPHDHFLLTCGGNKVFVWNFVPKRTPEPSTATLAALKLHKGPIVDQHRDVITCMEVSRDGNYLITGEQKFVLKHNLLLHVALN